MFQVLKDSEGRNIVNVKDLKKYHCPVMVFDLRKVEEAKKAFKEHKHIDGVMYTFGDPEKIVVGESAYKVLCTNGDERTGFPVGVHKWTFDEVINFKRSIGYEHLGLVIRKI